MVGRILRRLKDRGVLREPLRNHVSTHRRGFKRPYATRKPKDYPVAEPGDLIQLDTLDIRPLPGVVLKHFTAQDVISRWDVVDVYSRATATTAAHFLDTLEFYKVTESSFNVAELRGELLEWERTYDTVRPHQSLNYLTPLEFLQCYNKNQGKEVTYH